MPRRSTIDDIVDEVLREVESELEAEAGGKRSYRWWVSRREFGSGWEIVENLSTQEESYTPDDALVRHSAVVQMAYKQLRARGFTSGDMKVERFVEGRLDKRDPDKRGRANSGCSTAMLGKPLRIDDCVIYNR